MDLWRKDGLLKERKVYGDKEKKTIKCDIL